MEAEEHGGPEEDRSTGRNPMRIVQAAALLLLVAAALIAANVQWHLLPSLQIGTSQSWETNHPRQAGTGNRVLRLVEQPGLDTPAAVVRRWWIDDPRFGHIGVYVPVGRTPRDALTVALAERGIQVVP
jgi:hypothetical protein